MKILVYPTDVNPYQHLLSDKLRTIDGVKVTYVNGEKANFIHHVVGLFILPVRLFVYRLKGYKVFHSHWISFSSPLFSNLAIVRFLSTLYFLLSVSLIKLLKYKLIWTAHNILPHEKTYLNDLWVSKYMSKISDATIVHSKNIVNDMNTFGLATNNTSIIPHGNYIDIYPNVITRAQARKKLHIQKEKFVFLFLGQIRDYKGVDKLLIEFEKLSKNKKNALLLIAGKCPDQKLSNMLRNYEKKLGDKIRIVQSRITDNEIQYFYNASDIVVCPFKKITTSGSALLAISYKKPIIYPKIGALKDLANGIGYSYNQNDKNGLYDAMVKAIKNADDLKQLSNRAYQYAKSLDWSNIAEETIKIYK